MKIVVGMDGSDASIEALRFAADEAETLDADLTAVTVWEMPPLALGYVSAADASGAMDPWVEKAVDATLGEAGEKVTRRVETGSASAALLRVAEDADLLVVGSRGHGALAGVILGSVSNQLANHADCPLTVLPAPRDGSSHDPDGPIVVGVDGSSNATAALHWAADRAVRLGRRLRVVMAWRGEVAGWLAGTDVLDEWPADDDFKAQARDMLTEVVDEARLPDSLEVDLVLGEGAPATVIREACGGASMLVLGARGRGGFMGLLLGSVTAHLLNHLEGPTTVVPSS